MINEILQWIAIGVLFYPKISKFVHDFKEDEEEE